MKTYNEVTPTGLGQNRRQKRQAEQKSQPPPAKRSKEGEAEWPLSLLHFVNRSFKEAEALETADKKQFEEEILQLIYMAARDEKIWTNHWDSQTLPVFDKSGILILAQDVPKETNVNAEARAKTRTETKIEKKTETNAETKTGKKSESAALANSEISSSVRGKDKKKARKFDSEERKNERSARFGSPEVKLKSSAIVDPNMPIVGTLEALEKSYLRLTSAPDPSTVRPEHVLEQCLAYVIKKFKTTNNQYLYINDQLKAIRQDLTVQHIKNEFAMKVYELHGRIAIENDDLGEFNQCLSQLRYLYSLNRAEDNYYRTYEFQCYQVLYFLVLGNNTGISSISLGLLEHDSATDPTRLSRRYNQNRNCLYKAIELLRVMTEGNYHQFFEAYLWFKMHKFIPCAFVFIDKFLVTKVRVLAIHTMTKAYKKINKAFLIDQLKFKDDKEFKSFCMDFQLEQYLNGEEFDCATARLKLQTIVSEGQFKKVDIKGQV